MEETPTIRRAGPGAQPVATTTEFVSSIQGASEYEYVDIFNPLAMEFVAQLATDRPANMPARFQPTQDIRDERDLRHHYGVNLRNPDRQGNMHVTNQISIMPGATKRFMGNEAQVVARQLITEIIQQRGKAQFIADPQLRTELEQEIILSRGDIRSQMEQGPQTVQDQLRTAMMGEAPQKELTHEEAPAFPDARPAHEAEAADLPAPGDDSATPGKRIGRPPKSAPTA